MGWKKEIDPLEVMKELLNEKWVSYQETPKPYEIIVENDPKNPKSRVDLNYGDIVVIKKEPEEQIRQRGNFEYFDRVFPIAIEFYTKVSRERLANMGRMIRAICSENKHNFEGYQLIRLKGYSELVEETLNVWLGVQRVQVESAAVCAEKTK